jgi:hypothetical protein
MADGEVRVMSRFERGDHLQVRRRGVYWHQGVYVSDERVIEFGGGTIRDKGQSVIRPVSLGQFEGQGTAVIVQHPSEFLGGLGMGLPSTLPADEIVARAEWLIGKCPPGRYNLVGSNCEHLANWSVTCGYFESLQVRSYIAAKAVVDLAFLVRRHKLSPHLQLAIAGVLISGWVFPTMYWIVPHQWKDVLAQWPGYKSGKD